MLRFPLRWIALSAFLIGFAYSFYLPGLAPVNFCEANQRKAKCPSNVTLFVNKLDSDQSVIPYEYHSFDFCIGSEDESPVENLGQVLFGERIRPSPYQVINLDCSIIASSNLDKFQGTETMCAFVREELQYG
jgi:transmembrane 9 superfamily protein 2/4